MKISKPYLRPDGRKHVIVTKDDGSKTTRSFPRYLLEAKLGRKLSETETVDHVDGDFKNDYPDNLRSLSRAENASWAWKTGNCVPTPMSSNLKQFHKERMHGVKNPLAKFSEQQILDIKSRKQYYGCIRDWMKEFGVSRKTMYNLLHSKTY